MTRSALKTATALATLATFVGRQGVDESASNVPALLVGVGPEMEFHVPGKIYRREEVLHGLEILRASARAAA